MKDGQGGLHDSQRDKAPKTMLYGSDVLEDARWLRGPRQSRSPPLNTCPLVNTEMKTARGLKKSVSTGAQRILTRFALLRLFHDDPANTKLLDFGT